ncbi:3681_t:CDS:1, partial [Racocetra fulgida]
TNNNNKQQEYTASTQDNNNLLEEPILLDSLNPSIEQLISIYLESTLVAYDELTDMTTRKSTQYKRTSF